MSKVTPMSEVPLSSEGRRSLTGWHAIQLVFGAMDWTRQAPGAESLALSHSAWCVSPRLVLLALLGLVLKCSPAGTPANIHILGQCLELEHCVLREGKRGPPRQGV